MDPQTSGDQLQTVCRRKAHREPLEKLVLADGQIQVFQGTGATAPSYETENNHVRSVHFAELIHARNL